MATITFLQGFSYHTENKDVSNEKEDEMIKKHGYRNECRTATIPIRFSPSEVERVREIAKAAHDYPSSYLRRMVLAKLTDGRKEDTAQQ